MGFKGGKLKTKFVQWLAGTKGQGLMAFVTGRL